MEATEESGGLRARRKRETRAALIDAAFELFQAQGYAGTTMEEIAERAHVSRRTAFRYFPTKEGLVFPGQEGRLARFRELLAEGGGPPFETVRHACLTLAKEYMVEREHFLAQWELVQSEPTLQASELQLDREYEDAIAEVFASAERDTAKGRRRARVRAGAGLGAVRAVLRDWLEGGAEADLGRLGREAFTHLERGLG